MSGSGGGGGGGGGIGKKDCSSLFIKTYLNSPKPSVLNTLKKGDVLQVELAGTGARRIVQASTKKGAVAGSITGADLADLIACINEGYDFVAIVESVSGGSCEVTVRPK